MSSKYAACASFIKEKLQPLEATWRSESTLMRKIMGVASSNIGIGVIAGVMILGVILPYLIPHHSAANESMNSSAWNTPIDNSSSHTSKGIKAPPIPPSLQSQINTLKDNMTGMQQKINELTVEIAKQKSAPAMRTPYQLLGVRFDNDSQQWVADIQVGNAVKSVTAGEEFNGWHVENVDSQGASID
jgi:hypothetical protein